MEEILNIMLEQAGVIPNYVFLTSTSYGTDLKSFGDVPIYYSKLLATGTILYNDENYLKEHKHLFAYNFSDKMN